MKYFLSCFMFVALVLSDAMACDVGYYLKGDVCSQCEAGYYCYDGNEQERCTGATISEAGATECIACPEETPYANSGHTQCVACNDPGEYVMGNTICGSCTKGYYCPGDGVQHVCPKGSYSADDGMAQCISCPTGSTTSGPGAISDSACVSAPITLSFGEDSDVSLPDCLTHGKINTKFVKNN